MDPIAQLGWRNQRGQVEGPAAQLVRDVFVVANLMHKDAMSQMGGNTDIGGECGRPSCAVTHESMLPSTDHNTYMGCSEDGDLQG